MITPSFGITATERVLPKLALDFTTASLDSRVTFTRATGASNPATFTNSSGYVTAAANNQPRFDYDPVALTCKGLLIEESRTNSFLNSTDLSAASWSPYQSSITSESVTAPDGSSTSQKLVEAATTNIHELSTATQITITSGATITLSVYAKAAGRSKIKLFMFSATSPYEQVQASFDLSTGTYISSSGSSGGTVTGYSITSAGNGWYRCSVSGTIGTKTNWYPRLYLLNASGSESYAGDGTSGAYFYGPQHEAGAFATSYIPTTSAALTRNADVAMMTGTNFSDWYNAGIGGLSVDAIPKSISGTKPAIQFDDATILNTIVMQGNATALEMKITSLAVLQSTLSIGTLAANTVYGGCGAWGVGSNALSKNGAAPATGSPIAIPTVTQSRLGSDGTNYLNGWLQTIRYWPQRVTDAETQAFSK